MNHLVSARDLAVELEDSGSKGLVVIDVRWTLSTSAPSPGAEEYSAGHVPGAHFVDLDTELAAPPGEGGRHPLPDPAVVRATLRRCGADDDSRVVVYDGRESYAAARAWWVFRWVGLSNTRVLDGGYAAWLAAGLPSSAEVPPAGAGSFEAVPGSLPVVDADGAARWAREGLLLDARARARYAGEVEPIDPVAGHVPGAVNSPTSDWLTPEGTFRTDLADHWHRVRAGHDEGGQVAVYCGSGVTAAHYALALAEIGVDATLYPGSWSEWVRDPARPVATGADPG